MSDDKLTNLISTLNGFAARLAAENLTDRSGIKSADEMLMPRDDRPTNPKTAVAFAKALIKGIRLLNRGFNPSLFFDPALYMLLDLYVEEKRSGVSVTSLSHASFQPPTTALRHIQILERVGLAVRESDPFDKRKTILMLTPSGRSAMTHWLEAFLSMIMHDVSKA